MSLLSHFKRVDYYSYQQQQKQIEEQCAAQVAEHQNAKRNGLLTKRGPGRPKRPKIVHLRHSSEETPTPGCYNDSNTTNATVLRKQKDWFNSVLIHEILHAAKMFPHSSRGVVEYLQRKYPKFETEEEGRYDSLNESTVRYWFDENWKLKPQFQQAVQLSTNQHSRGQGRCPILSKYPDVVKEMVEILGAMRNDGYQTMNYFIISKVMKSVVKRNVPGLLDVLKFSSYYVYQFVDTHLDWAKRRSTTGAKKLPDNWKDLAITMGKRIAIKIDELNNTLSVKNSFHRSLLINFDQTGVHLVPKSNYTFAPRGSNSVPTIGAEDKRQITAIVASSADGDLLPLQLIFSGKTTDCHPPITSTVHNAKFHITHSPNHWSNQETMQQYIKEIIVPYLQSKIAQHNLPADSKAILVLDCWSVHKSKEFRVHVFKNHPNVILVYIPPNCTSKVQVADVMLNFPFKHGIKFRFNNWAADIIEEQVMNKVPPSSIGITEQLKMAVIKPLILEWCYETWKSMSEKRDMVRHGWEKSLFSLIDPFDLRVQNDANREARMNAAFNADEHFGEQVEDEDHHDAGAAQWDECSSDEEKDELDVMKEIRHGTRRSRRDKKQPEKLHGYMSIDTSLLSLPPFKSSSSSSSSSSIREAKKKRKKK